MPDTAETLAELKFTLDSCLWFAGATGDYNPLHVDPAYPPTTPFEANVVHGMLVVIAALDAACAGSKAAGAIVRIDGIFAKPVFHGDRVRVVATVWSERKVRLAVVKDDETLVRISVELARTADETPPPAWCVARRYETQAPAEPDMADAAPQAFPLRLCAAQQEIAARYPAVAGALGRGQLASLALLSTAVGMHRPGLRSLFSNFTARFPGEGGADRLVVTPQPHDERLGLTQMSAQNAFMAADLQAFVLPGPSPQPTCAVLRDHVAAGEFEGQSAIVIGATEGIGAVTARMLALGGARLLITYRRKAEAAEAVRDDIRSIGGRCDLVRLDLDEAGALDAIAWTELNAAYIYATPRIFLRTTAFFDFNRFAAFSRAYVEPLVAIAARLHGGKASPRKAIFYPSTVAIDENVVDLNEYAAAKLAGEFIAGNIARKYKDVQVLVRRLPRLDTPQTNQVIRVPSSPIPVVMAPILRDMTAAVGATSAGSGRS